MVRLDLGTKTSLLGFGNITIWLETDSLVTTKKYPVVSHLQVLKQKPKPQSLA